MLNRKQGPEYSGFPRLFITTYYHRVLHPLWDGGQPNIHLSLLLCNLSLTISFLIQLVHLNNSDIFRIIVPIYTYHRCLSGGEFNQCCYSDHEWNRPLEAIFRSFTSKLYHINPGGRFKNLKCRFRGCITHRPVLQSIGANVPSFTTGAILSGKHYDKGLQRPQ